MTDSTPTVASVVGRNFTDRLAAHLADVKNADKAHRLVRPETDQKLEALQRMTAEAWSKIMELEGAVDEERTSRLERLERE